MNILFITRKYPPVKGGMEQVAHELVKGFRRKNRIFLLANRHSQKWLPLFGLYVLFKSLFLIFTRRIDVIYLGDGAMSIFTPLFKMFNKRVCVTVHGLDITLNNRFYQSIMPSFVNRCDRVICVSSQTMVECQKRSIQSKRLRVINNGINPEKFSVPQNKPAVRKQLDERLTDQFGVNIRGTKILITVGRLVKRKGVAWFVENVVPKLPKSMTYLVCGDGPMRQKIQHAIQRRRLSNVHLLGRVDDAFLKLLYNGADLFIMPNIKVKGDMEGFGLVALEAASCGLPPIAANIEGIRDAIEHNRTGMLVESRDTAGFVKTIRTALTRNKHTALSKSCKQIAKERHAWTSSVEKYLLLFHTLHKKTQIRRRRNN